METCKESMIDEFEVNSISFCGNRFPSKTFEYGYLNESANVGNTGLLNMNYNSNSWNGFGNRLKVNERRTSPSEVRQLEKMSNILQKSSYRFSPIDNSVDREITRSYWSREEIALFCLRSMDNNIKRAVKSYKSFTTMMSKFNSKNGNEIDIHNPTILSQLRTGKVVIFDKLDLHSRLLVIINLHYHDPKLQSVDDLILLFVFVIELIMRENPHDSAAEKNGLSILMNASKIGFSDFRMEYCIRISQMLTKHFPIKLGQLLIFKPSWLVKLSIRLVMATQKKLKKRFQIITKVFEPLNSITDFDALSHYIDRNHIPIELGGKHEFNSERFWEIKYQGHILAELFQKRKVLEKVPEPLSCSRKDQDHQQGNSRKKYRDKKKRLQDEYDQFCLNDKLDLSSYYQLYSHERFGNDVTIPEIEITSVN
ncbi:SEC14d domain-containing protein [Cryptosporidium felis]|nr:SEC14d domain-containing protein [Cryptosporidium felis]